MKNYYRSLHGSHRRYADARGDGRAEGINKKLRVNNRAEAARVNCNLTFARSFSLFLVRRRLPTLNARINNTRGQDSRNESATRQARFDPRKSARDERKPTLARRCSAVENQYVAKSLAVFRGEKFSQGRSSALGFSRRPYCLPIARIAHMHNNSPVMLCGLPCDISQPRPPF